MENSKEKQKSPEGRGMDHSPMAAGKPEEWESDFPLPEPADEKFCQIVVVAVVEG
ncbi:MAG: hypothetical protein AAF191_19320 [Verrucomicrobiota bacterium]